MTTPAMPEPLGWYVVNNIGMATLCKDEAEAQLLAEDCDMVYQRQAPHRAVQLVALAALQSAQPAGHSCIFHAAPLTPGDTRGPQFAVCAICGQPPRVLGTSQPAAAVSDEAIYAVWAQHCQTPGTTTRQLVCGFARAIPALSPAQQAPEWDGGEPANLQAAARDADEWLALIQRLKDAGRWLFSQPDSRSKLDGCRAALSKILCAPAQQAVPMTDEQIKAARRSVCDDPNELPEPWAFRMGIRAAEAHHGITQRADGVEQQA